MFARPVTSARPSLAAPAGRRIGLMAATALLAFGLSACQDEQKQAEAPAAPAATEQKPAETAAAPAATPAPATAPAETAAAPAVDLPAPDATVDAAALLAPGPMKEMELGNPQAPVTVIEYASLTCGHCGAFHTSTFQDLKAKYIDTGKIRFIFREYPFDALAEAGFMLARCNENVYFPMVSALFAAQSNWVRAEKPSEAMFQISRQAGFTQEQFNACLSDQTVLDNIRAVRTKGADVFKVDSTPTFFINGKKYTGNMSTDVFSGLIEREM
ncbi:MAG: DsbA family protein [Rhizobiaceae bacterium]|jgi:protein-disulfide isomerase|nr:DsbA family protein [Rhizobiaceae bacterium]